MQISESLRDIHVFLATRMAEFLLGNQVIWPREIRLKVDCENVLTHKLLGSSDAPLSLKIFAARGKIAIRARNKLTMKPGEFFRVSEKGLIANIPGFHGLRSYNKSSSPRGRSNVASEDARDSMLRRVLRTSPVLIGILRSIRDAVITQVPSELSATEGVTFRFIEKGEAGGTVYALECYDHGGIFDRQLNAEGLTYPPQVPGNYYADAYSTLVFLWQYENIGGQKWIDGAERSWVFLTAVYPQYRPAKIVWHHSDFKNAAILEVVRKYSNKYPQFNWCQKPLVEDHYEPTNVFALRGHWKSLARILRLSEESMESLESDLERLLRDQNAEGLFHDNVETYQDAHDLTYHQYTTACLGQMRQYHDSAIIASMFSRACQFSLSFCGPNGEPAYTGRASNNLHHSASFILSMHIWASQSADPDKRTIILTAAKLAAERIARYQNANGFIPTALNNEQRDRMGWNHCGTPYNALAAYFLLRSLDFLPQSHIEYRAELPLEMHGVYIAPDSGFASISNPQGHIVVFSGCDESYGWSENRHKTGAGGLALVGFRGFSAAEIPCLDVDVEHGTLVSDLPRINGEYPYGRAELRANDLEDSIVYRHSYGDAYIVRRYSLGPKRVIIETSIHSEKPCVVEGLVKWPILDRSSAKWRAKNCVFGSAVWRQCNDSIELAYEVSASRDVRLRLSRKVSNPKGYCRIITSGRHQFQGAARAILTITFSAASGVGK